MKNVCMCVYYVCMYVCMYVCVYIMYVCVYIMYVCVYIIYVCVCILCMYVCIYYVCMYVCMYVYSKIMKRIEELRGIGVGWMIIFRGILRTDIQTNVRIQIHYVSS